MAEKNIDRILDIIIDKLESLHENQSTLSKEIQQTNLELSKISGLKHIIGDLKSWKEDSDKVVNLDDFRRIKEFCSNNHDINSHIEDLYLIIGELRTITDDYRKFKVKTMTVIAVLTTIFTALVSLIGLLAKS